MATIPGPNNSLITQLPPPTASLAALAFSQTVPTASAYPGTAGTVAFASGSFYVCVATNTWQKAVLAGF